MQPHSMCAVALANYVWNSATWMELEKVQMRVDYKDRYGASKFNIYELWNIQRDRDDREMRVQIMRGGGGINCTITLRRNTPQEGAEVTMTHSEQHIAGLREVFYLYKEKISSGKHYNSLKYGDFEGYNNHPDRRRIALYCDLRMSAHTFVRIKYELEITDVKSKILQFPTPENRRAA